MATILVTHAGSPRAVPLAASTLVGRGWPCLARVHDAGVPLYWIELRWQAGWTWRVLAADERTRGPGTVRDDGWRDLPCGTPRRPMAVRLGEDLSVELVEDGPPTPFLHEPATGEFLRGDAVGSMVEVRGDALLPLEAEGNPAMALHDGDTLVHEGRVLRVHGVSAPLATSRLRIDLARPCARVLVDESPLRATLLQGDAHLELTGEHLRTLLVYAQARAADPSGGWLRPSDAWSRWRAAGGNMDSPPERLSWDRARIRAELHAAGVGHPEALFEVARDALGARVRLALTP